MAAIARRRRTEHQRTNPPPAIRPFFSIRAPDGNPLNHGLRPSTISVVPAETYLAYPCVPTTDFRSSIVDIPWAVLAVSDTNEPSKATCGR
ncbi:hypothetical protein D805_0282 [Bifidobacterium thermophilum RBL67]|uniref:Uncharacterized protein n=1 Tax=Bifidobacterium thermophilum RBL67 TaxID=1254439 RepID=M4REH2_9BIFI|nr:hypothetical protein D805_0282 [Bifidobacterium thermophilum RBL67]